jgi:hypothetical protein
LSHFGPLDRRRGMYVVVLLLAVIANFVAYRRAVDAR